MNWQQAVEKTVTGLGYELVDCVFGTRGLLVVTIDRLPEHVYPSGPGVSVTVDDCELVTRQLQYLLEVENVDYARLEVSSPGLDRMALAQYCRPRDWPDAHTSASAAQAALLSTLTALNLSSRQRPRRRAIAVQGQHSS